MPIYLESGGLTTLLREHLPPTPTAYTGSGTDLLNYMGSLLNPDEVYRTQRAVRTVVNFIAHNSAVVHLKAYNLDPDDERTEVRSDLVRRTLGLPDGSQTSYEYLRNQFTDVLLWERFAAAKTRAAGGPLQLIRVPPSKFTFERDGYGAVTGLKIGQDVFDIKNFLWLDGYPASSSSPMGHLQDLLLEEAESAAFRTKLWRMGARMGGFIERPLDAPDWSPRARKRFMALLDERYTGNGERVGGTMLLEDGMVYKDGAHMTSRDAQQIEARKLATSEVAAAYQVPPVFVGVLDNANYSNVRAYRQMLYDDVLGPLLTQSSQAWTWRVGIPELGVDKVEHDTEAKLQVSFIEEAAMLQSAVGAPYMTRAEARKRRNLPHIEGTDELVEPLNVSVGDDPLDDEEPTALSGGNNDSQEEEEENS